MVLSTISVLLAFVIFIGRPAAAFGGIRKALWFFSYFELKRIVLVLISLTLGIAGLSMNFDNNLARISLAITFLFSFLTFLMDFKYIFPEINQLEKVSPTTVKIDLKERVIGVVVKRTAVAYPLKVLVPRHIINDVVEDIPVLVSYCALCRSALVFEASVEDKALKFSVAGVWRRNMIMVDNISESIWQQATGECIYGKFKGKKLKLLSGENTTWESWLRENPQSLFPINFKESRRGFASRDFMLKGLEFATSRITSPGKTKLTDLKPREIVFGIKFNGITRAYPLSNMIGKRKFEDKFGDKILLLEYDASSEYLQAVEKTNKRAVIVEKHWWLGWKEFHPETEIYGFP